MLLRCARDVHERVIERIEVSVSRRRRPRSVPVECRLHLLPCERATAALSEVAEQRDLDIGPRLAHLGGGIRLGFAPIELAGSRLSHSRPINSIRSSADSVSTEQKGETMLEIMCRALDGRNPSAP